MPNGTLFEETATPTSSAMDELLDELPLGVLLLDEQHALGRCNPIARQLLDSPIGGELQRTLEKMAGRAAVTGHLVEAVMTAGTVGELRLMLAHSPSGTGFTAYVERSATSRLRAEIQILRALLAAVTDESSPGDAIQPGLASLAGTLSSGWVALFEIDPAARELRCIAHVKVPPEHQTYLRPHAIDAAASAVARAAVLGGPVHLRALARSPFPAEREMVGGDKFAGLALAVRSADKILGSIFVCGTVGILGEGEIRLVQGLADAVGALLERSRRDRALRREQEARRTLMDNLPDAILESGPGGVIALAAGRVAAILGRSAEQLVGAQLADLIAEAQRPAFIEQMRAAGRERAMVVEASVVHPDQRVVEVALARASPESDLSVRAVFRDVTQRRKLEAEVLRSRELAVQRERMALIGQIAAAITHEINNPLAFVRSNIELLESLIPTHLVASDEVRAKMVNESLRDSLQGLDRVNSIISALKSLARKNARDPVEFDPETPIREAILIFERARSGGAKVKLDLPALPRVTGSPSGLSQVLLNLLDNALDATGQTQNPIEISAREEDGGVVLRVRDHGRGVSLAALPHLFEPYFTTKESGKGTGLGLYLSRDILAATGGRLELEPSSEGAVFRIFLPAAL